MALVDSITQGANWAIDSDALIYYVEENPTFLASVEPAFELINAKRVRGHVSFISLLEVLVQPVRRDRPDLVERYKSILLDRDAFTLHDVKSSTAELAARIRAGVRVEVSDSIVAATAFEAGCDFLITNNGDDFKKIPGLNVLVINDYI